MSKPDRFIIDFIKLFCERTECDNVHLAEQVIKKCMLDAGINRLLKNQNTVTKIDSTTQTDIQRQNNIAIQTKPTNTPKPVILPPTPSTTQSTVVLKGYSLFIRECYEQDKNTNMREIGTRWHALTAGQRASYD